MLRSTLRPVILAFIVVAWAASAHADLIQVDLESLTDGDALSNQIPGLSFTNATILTAGLSLNEIDFPPASGVNVAVDDGGPIRIDFLIPVLSFGAHFTYVSQLQLQAFDASNNLLGNVASAFFSNFATGGDPGSAPNELLEAAFAGMAYVTITGDPGGFSFVMDDLVINTVGQVPEPGTLSLLLLGFGASVARFTSSRRIGAKRC
jgi:hypothetical protein